MRQAPMWIILGVLAVAVLLGGQAVTLYTDWLWFQEVGFAGVFRTILYVKTVLGLLGGAVVFLLVYLNLRVTARGHGEIWGTEDAETPQLPSWPVIRPLYQTLLLPGALVLGVLLGGQAASGWEDFLRARNAGSFGVVDPLFGRDVGFYVFTYPLLTAVYRFLSLALLVTLVAVGAVYVLSRGVRLTPRGPAATPWARGHLFALAAALFLVKAWGYSLDRYGLLFTPGGASFGAGYTDVNATLPALTVVGGLAVLAALACLVQIARPGFRLVLGGTGLWLAGSLIGLTAYPAVLQRFRVVPNEIAAERPYIERTIRATNRAYGLDGLEARPFPAREDLSVAALRKNDATIKNIRLWEHRPALDSYGQLQEIRTYYRFTDVDNDRYLIDGEYRQLMLSVRELSHENLPSRIWINEALVYTHGYGAVVGPVNRVTREGLPEFFVKDIPPVTTGPLTITRPELVFGPRQVDARIDQDALISQQLTLWSQAGSRVIRGGLLAIPIEESLLYVQPLYLAAERGRLPELKRVITAFGNRIAMEETLEASLQQLFGGRPSPADAAPTPVGADTPSGRALAGQAMEHFRKAQEHLRRWNWTGFGEELREVEEILRRLQGESKP